MAFQIAAFVILSIFYGCHIAKAIIQRKSGVKTNCLGKGKTDFLKRLEIILEIATVVALAAEIISIALNTGSFPTPLRFAGLFFATVGTIFFVITVCAMKDSWRVGVPRGEKTRLVTSGIFQIGRNPAFLGFYLTYIGIVLAFFNFPLLFISVFAGVTLHLQIVRNEEPFLQETFGEEYSEYKNRVNRYAGRRRQSFKNQTKTEPARKNRGER